MLMTAIKLAVGGLLIFWALQAIAFMARLARLGIFRSMREIHEDQNPAQEEKLLRLIH
jgi:hypothetical protein